MGQRYAHRCAGLLQKLEFLFYHPVASLFSLTSVGVMWLVSLHISDVPGFKSDNRTY
jgi:hypothetical protein